jgi:hypothetical protein
MTQKTRLDYTRHRVPEHTQEALERYFFLGLEPGGFLTSVLSNDLMGACTRSDHVNRENIVGIATWVLHSAPNESWGHLGAVANWCKDEGGCRTRWVEAFEKRMMWNELSAK